jgi:hypothetical protein
MSVEIEPLKLEIDAAKLTLETSDGRRFFAKIDKAGISFHSRVSSSGALESKPITKSVDDLFDWISNEGANKPFRTRKDVQPRKAKAAEGKK